MSNATRAPDCPDASKRRKEEREPGPPLPPVPPTRLARGWLLPKSQPHFFGFPTKREIPEKLQTFTIGLQVALRASLAAGLSIAIARQFGLQHPLYAFLAAVIVTDLVPSVSRRLAVLRLVATLIGALWGAMLSQLLPADDWVIGTSILIAMLTCQLLHSFEGAKVAGFICGIVVLEHGAMPWASAFNRLIETGLGIVVALAISYVPKLIRLGEPPKQDRDAIIG